MKQMHMARVRAITTATILATAFAANGAVWNTETVHSWNDRDCGVECDIALDSNGDPHFGYIVGKLSYPREQVLYHAWKDGASWSHEQVYTNFNGASTDAAIRMSGTTPTLYQTDDSIYAWWQGLRSHTKTGGVWSNTQMDQYAWGSLSAIPSGVAYPSRVSSSNTTSALWFNGTVVDSGSALARGCGAGERGGTIGICHRSQEDGGVMKLAENTGSGWSNEVIAPMTGGAIAGSGYRSGMAYDSEGRPHVAYSDTSVATPWISYAVRDNGTWHTQQLARCNGGSVSVGVDSKDRPHVIFPNQSQDLAHGIYNGTDWKFMGLRSMDRHSALVIDASDILHVACRDAATGGDRLYHLTGEFVASNKLLNAQFDSDSVAWNFGDIEGDEGIILGSLYQIDDPADPSNKVCQIHAHNYWGNSQCSAGLEQEIDVADKMQWLEFDYRFLSPGTYIEVRLGTEWSDTSDVLGTLPWEASPAGEFIRCGIPLPFNRQDSKDADLSVRLVGGSEEDYYALVDNFELVESGSPRLGTSVKLLAVTVEVGSSPPDKAFNIWNTGTNDLGYSMSADAAWFSLPAPSGTLTGQVETVEVEFDTAALVVGSYTGKLAIAAAGLATQSVDVVLSVEPPPVEITTLTVPSGEVGTAYSFQLEAVNGTLPYAWSTVAADYVESAALNSFAATGTAKGWSGTDTTWQLNLPFSFLFYGSSYSTCWVDCNGRITFADVGSLDYPNEEEFLATPMIAVLWEYLDPDEIYVDQSADQITIRWEGSYGYSGSPSINISLTLADDGAITMKYGTGNTWGGWIGISAGDGSNYLYIDQDYNNMQNADDILLLQPPVLPDGLALSTNGLLSGTPTTAFSNEVGFMVTDAKGGFDSEWLELVVAGGGVVEDADGDGIPDWWEILYFGSTANCVATNHNDGDTFNNLHEYIAGTDPTNGASFFRITNAWQHATGYVVEWGPAVAERWYSVLWTNDLTGSFSSLVWGIDFPQSSATDTIHAAENEGFYKVEVQLK